jgi:hypothetical protein
LRAWAEFLDWKTNMPHLNQPRLARRSSSELDNMPIHVGDIVHLQPIDGPRVRARVIYNAPINGSVTYTTELIPAMTDSGRQTRWRFRFRHEHVHRIEPVRG